MSRRPLDPRRCNAAIDNNALDKDGTTRDAMIDRFLELQQSRRINIVVPQGVRRESQHPNTPDDVRSEIGSKIFTLPVELTPPERAERRRVRAILQGNAQPGKHAAYAWHLFEAGKYGGGYFVTNDRRMINKRQELAEVLPPSLNIVTLEEFLRTFDDFEINRRI